MQKINDRIQDILKQHKTKKQYLFVLFLLSIMIIAAVCFSLMTPAVSMSGQLVCTKVPHSHSDACYERHITCTENTEGHTHSDDCYTAETTLICGFEEDETHSHSDQCYAEEKVLICEIPETEGHVHTDECYTNELICGQEEHIHSADCYNIATKNADITTEPEASDAEIEEQLGEVIMTMPNKLRKEFAINDNVDFNITDKSIDFGHLITGIEHREVEDKIRPEYVDNQIAYYYRNVDFTINYEITRTELTSKDANNRKIYCELSNDIVIRGVREGNVLKDSKIIGKYNISNDNRIVIVFNDDIIMEGERIEGDIQFNADVKKIDDNSGFEKVKIGNLDVEIPFADMSISKSNKEIESDEEGIVKAEYTVKVNSNCGSGNGNITLTDSLTNKNSNNDEIKIDRNSIKVTKNNSDGSSEIVPNANFADDKNFTISGLAALAPNESYTITYTVSMRPDPATVNLSTNNIATASNESLTSSTNSSFSKAVGCDILKSGSYDNKTEKLTWEVIVENPSSLSLEGYTVEDKMLKDANSIKIQKKVNGNWESPEQIDRSNLSSLSGTFDINTNKFTFNEVYGSSYKLTYEIDVTEEWLNSVDPAYKEHDSWNNFDKIKNIAVLTPPGDAPLVKTGEGTATVTPTRNEIKKAKGTVTHDEQKNAIIPWNVTLEGVLGKFGNQTYTDAMTDSDNGNYHYMTVDQLRELKVYGQFSRTDEWNNVYVDWGLLTLGSDYTIIVNGIEINSNTDFNNVNDKINTFDVKFIDSDNIKKQSDIKLEYSTMGIVKDIPVNGKRTYTNTATFKEKSVSATHEEKNDPPIYKYDTRDTGKDSTSHNLNDLIINDKYVLKWYIDVEPSLCSLSGDGSIVLIDTLPVGTSLNEDSVLYANQKQNKDQGFTVNGQEITFTIPQSIHNGQKIRIDYDVTISEDAVPQLDNEERTFENTVKISDDSYKTTQKQTIKKIPLDKLSKTGPAKLDVYNGHINYTVDINPKGETLNNGKPMTIVDIISHPNIWYGKLCTFTLDSLSINIIEKDGVRTPLTATDYTLSPLTEESTGAKFIIEGLPDGKHLEINYVFTAFYTEAGKNDKVTVNGWEDFTDDQIGTLSGSGGLIIGPHEVEWGVLITNRAELHLDSGEVINKEVSENYFIEYGDRAHATTESQIYKYEAGHFNIGLPNAHFALYKYNTDGVKSTVSDDLVTNEYGMISLSSLVEGELYEAVETSAPTGYAKSNLPYYFAYSSMPDSTVLTAANITDSNKVQVLNRGQNINISNSKILPETGGSGTKPYIITGILLMAGSAVMYYLCIKRRRRRIK